MFASGGYSDIVRDTMLLQSVDQLPISFYEKLLFRGSLVRLYLSYPIESFVAKAEWRVLQFIQLLSYICTASLFRWVYQVQVVRRGQISLQQYQQPYVIVSNHIRRLDPVLLFASLSFSSFQQLAPIKVFTANKYLEGFLTILHSLGAFRAYSIPPKRSGLREGLHLIDQNFNLLIFPEGKRNPTREKIELKIGAAYLSEKRNVNFIPVAIQKNDAGILVTWGEPFQINRKAEESMETYNERIFNQVRKLLN